MYLWGLFVEAIQLIGAILGILLLGISMLLGLLGVLGGIVWLFIFSIPIGVIAALIVFVGLTMIAIHERWI